MGGDDATQLKHLLGNDPLPGNQAVEYFAAKGSACIPLIIDSFESAYFSYQARHRIVRLFGMLGDDAAGPLVDVIRNGSWWAKLMASECFGNLNAGSRRVDALGALVDPLVTDPEVTRAAILALGHSKAWGWGVRITHVAFSNAYTFEKHRTASLEALARFVTAERSEHSISRSIEQLGSFVSRWTELDQKEPTRSDERFGDDEIDLIYMVFSHLKPIAAKPIINFWSRSTNKLFRQLAALALGRLRLDWTLKHCINRFLDPAEDMEVRSIYALDLGFLDNPAALRPLLDVLSPLYGVYTSEVGLNNKPDIERDRFLWRILFAVAALLRHMHGQFGQSEVEVWLPYLFRAGLELRCQTLYSIGLLGYSSEYIDRFLLSENWLERGFAALALARTKGPAVLPSLRRMVLSQVSHPVEALLALVAAIYAGDTGKTRELHATLCAASSGNKELIPESAPTHSPEMEHLRYLWAREIVFALAHGGEQGQIQAAAWADLLNLNLERVFLEMEQLGFSLHQHAPHSGQGAPPAAPAAAATKAEELTLTPPQLKQLYDALLSAFSAPELEGLTLFQLGIDLYHIVSPQASPATIVQRLIQWARAQGRLRDLVEAASNSNPDNPQLRSFLKSINFVPRSEHQGS